MDSHHENNSSTKSEIALVGDRQCASRSNRVSGSDRSIGLSGPVGCCPAFLGIVGTLGGRSETLS